MNTALIDSEIVDLFSRITGQKLSQRDITPCVIFLTALITVLLGVMFVDNTVTDEEKQRGQKTINRFIPVESNVRQLTQLISKGVRQNQLYIKLDQLIMLTAPLSESEKLLLISFGYEMSAADGEMDFREKKYLEVVAKRLSINPQHLAVLEAGFSHKGIIEPAALDEVHFLLDPARFQSLGAVFVKAAKDMLAALPAKTKHQASQRQRASSYKQLKEFQKYRKQLDSFYNQLFQIIQDCTNRGFLPHALIYEIGEASRKLQSKRFRLAVVGEFSKGKSTLLNALLNEEIQPVRDIPCSGTVTVLKYGAQKRVVCRYKDGQEEVIPFVQYQQKAVISEEAALGSLTDELARSEIDEIIFEHPALDLCSSGVEIVDSPGLNEHPERTAITQKLVKDTDAAIFLTNALQVLTQGERDLLQDLQTHLNGGKADVPAENLFVVVNFWDSLRTETGRKQVQQRVANIVHGQNPIITGENRVHFISAQKALEAVLNATEDEYLKSFQSFTQSIEKFLTLERGSLEIKQSVTKIKGLIQAGLDGLHQAEEVLDGKINLSEAERQKILEQIGEASGRDVRIRQIANQILDEVVDKSNESWNKWIEELEIRLFVKAVEWSSNHSAIWSRDELANDYARQFNKDLSLELESWINNQLKQVVLKPPLELLDNIIKQELQTIKFEFENFNYLLDNESLNMTFVGECQADFSSNATQGFWGGLGAVGIGAALVPVVFLAGPILAVLAGIGAGVFGGGGIVAIEETIKENVLKMGSEQFVNSLDNIVEKINEIIDSVFYDRVNAASEIIEKAILFYENLLEQQEKAHKKTLEERKAEKARIFQKRRELEQVQHNIEAIFN